MIIYNIADCVANLELFKRLDLINQVICLSYCSNSWIRDVVLYNTGAMETSCICRNAYNLGYQFVWNRCDAKPNYFKVGELLYYGPQVMDSVMAIDFVSMYPSIMYSCGISPESIDYIDLVHFLHQIFHIIS